MKFSTKVPILFSNSFMKKKIYRAPTLHETPFQEFECIHGAGGETDKKVLLSSYLHLGTNLRTM